MKYEKKNKEFNKNQFLVPYMISSHPGSELKDAIELALYLKKIKHTPQQVQDFYPTPFTMSTCMYYTEKNPLTGEKVYVAGFGRVEYEGPHYCEDGTDIYENGNKIGVMG